MKVVWTVVSLLLIAGLIVVFQPSPHGPMRFDATAMESDAERIVEQAPIAPTTAPATEPNSASTKATTTAINTAAPVIEPKTTPEATTPSAAVGAPSIAPAATPSAEQVAAPAPVAKTPVAETAEEPAPATAQAIAAGAIFTPEIPTIAHAEILPSTFVRLADGAISVDDVWTIHGDGSSESPFEVSWEFLASAQETYTPRLGEKKLPARIAFLSGKHVRISGYLAFPLVAPTASECLVMLNQWDGCCIGIPPSPYDAIEVKLATERKGWRKHSINFGAIDGVLKVEPYLIENWLVGLYLFEGAKIDEGL